MSRAGFDRAGAKVSVEGAGSADGVRPVGERATRALAALSDGVAELGSLDPRDLPGAQAHSLLGEIESLTRRLASVRARLLTAIEVDGLWAIDGARSFTAWLRRATAWSAPEANRQARTARALRDHLPATASALDSGSITPEHAHLMATHTTTTPECVQALGHPEIGEAFLVDQATRLDATDFSRLLRAWAIAADPAGADGTYAEDLDRQQLVLAKTLNGYHLQGWLSDTNGAALDAALLALIGVPDAADTRTSAQRRADALVNLAHHALDAGLAVPHATVRPHLSVHVPHDTLQRLAIAQSPSPSTPSPSTPSPHRGDRVAGDREPSRSPAEPFTGPGRFAWPVRPLGALASPRDPVIDTGSAIGSGIAIDTGSDTGSDTASEAAIDSSGDAASSRTSAQGLIPGGLDHAVLIGATAAELDDGTPLSPALLARLTCDSRLSRVVFGPRSEVLDVGRAQRLFPPGQRRGIIARDRTCRYPGCDAPPAHGEVHHTIWWYAQHGTTRVDDGILLCWAHHDYVHAHHITITRSAAEGSPSWTFTRPNGNRITAGGPAPLALPGNQNRALPSNQQCARPGNQQQPGAPEPEDEPSG